MRKHIKFFEELTFIPKDIHYDLNESENVKEYQFFFSDFSFIVEFTRQVVDDTYEIYNYDELSEHEEVIISGWRRDFYTEENGYSSIKQSSSTALSIYSFVTRITQDFIDSFQPEFLVTTHTSASRFKLNLRFVNNLNIPGYSVSYTTGTYPKTFIYQNQYKPEIDQIMK